GLGQYWYLNEDLIAKALATNSTLKNTHDIFTVVDNGKTVNGGFVSSFNLTNAGMAITVANAVHGMPLRFFGDYVHNSGAEDGNDDGYMGGLKLGQAKARGDWTVGAFYEHLEKDATLSVYSNSDFGLGGTNNEGPVVTAEYQLLDPLTLSVRNY